jgi:hypothetical protein
MASIEELKNLRQYILFIYSLTSLSQKIKVKVIRELFGYRDKKEKKTYEHKGLVDRTYSKKLAQNVILVPFIQKQYFVDFFKSYNIKYEVKELWLKD